jgi:hypothetical protein
VQFPGRLNALQAEVADVVQVSRRARFGWDLKTFEVYNAQFKVFEGKNNANEIGIDLGIRETDAAVYAWNPTTDETVLAFVGTRIQSAGGSTVKKYFTDGTEGVNGVQYQISVVVKNQGTTNVFIDSNYSVSSAIPPGATQNVSLIVTADGTKDVQIIFETASSGDSMDVLAVNPIIARVSNGINLVPPINQTFQNWVPLNGAIITLTQLKPSLPDMSTVVAPTNLIASNDTFTRLDGVKKTRIKAVWTSPADQFVTSGGWIHMEVSDHADGSSPKIWKFGARVPGAETVAYFEGPLDSHTYDVRISSENASGSRSTPLEADGLLVSDVYSQISSTSFGNQGSIRPTAMPVWTVAQNTNDGAGNCTVRLTTPAKSLPLTDGSTISLPAVDVTWVATLAGSTTYLFAPRFKTADGTVHWATGTGSNVNADPSTPPLTSGATTDQKNQLAINQHFDGYIPLSDGFINITTPNNGGTGGGSSGGDPSCIHEREKVSIYPGVCVEARVVDVGDLIRGVDLKTGKPVFRKVISKSREYCADWYEVNGHLITPGEPVWMKSFWVAAALIKGAIFKENHGGHKISLGIDGEDFDACNFVLIAPDGTETIVHNFVLPRS